MAYNRRDFLKVTSSAGIGLMVGVVLPYKKRLIASGIAKDSFEPNVWIKIQSDNIINIVNFLSGNPKLDKFNSLLPLPNNLNTAFSP